MRKWWKQMVGVSGLFFAYGSFGCQTPTSFEGEAKFPGGPHGCFERCRSQQMEMASFVYVGEYSTACACTLRHGTPAGQTGPTADSTDIEAEATAGAAATAGAELQRRRIEAQQQQAAANASHPMYVPH